MLINIIFLIINIIVLIFAFFLIRSRIEKKVVNKTILTNVKKEINSIIIELNKTTLNNVSLIEEKLKELDKKIILADRKKNDLFIKKEQNKKEQNQKELFSFENKKNTYSPLKVINQTRKHTENLINSEKNEELKRINEKIKDMPLMDKVNYLMDFGLSKIEIKKMLGMSSGEFELLLNTRDLVKN